MDYREPQNQTVNELDQLLELHGNSLAGKVWRGTRGSRGSRGSRGAHGHGGRRQTAKILSTGYSKLDRQLHDSGWPLTTTTELGLSQPGIGELRLLTPALRELQNGLQGNIIWVAPPFLPFAPALFKEQIDVNQLTVVQTNSMQDTLWAAEQALLAECCAAVFTWTGSYNLGTRELRRLQLAAEKTHTWNVLFRHSDCLKQSSTAGLRLHLKSNAYSQLDIHILKQPQGWGGQRCSLSLQPHYENWQRLPAHLLPHHNRAFNNTGLAAHNNTGLAAHNNTRPAARNNSKTAPPEQLNDSSNTDHRQATVTVLTSLAALQTIH